MKVIIIAITVLFMIGGMVWFLEKANSCKNCYYIKSAYQRMNDKPYGALSRCVCPLSQKHGKRIGVNEVNKKWMCKYYKEQQCKQ